MPGLEVVGEVVESAVPELRPGDRVWTTMQGFGGVRAERDGGYAEHATVAAAALAPLPDDVDPVAFAAVGLAGVTAWGGLEKLGPLAGRTVIVTGAAGGVGSVAALFARAAGAEEVAMGRDAPPPAPRRADAVLDAAAGPLFPSLVAALRPGGRYALVGAVAGGDVALDAWALLHVVLTGYSTEDLDGAALRAATARFSRRGCRPCRTPCCRSPRRRARTTCPSGAS